MEKPDICAVLGKIRALLERCDEKQWAQEFIYLQELFDRAYEIKSDVRKREALDRISLLFGGMGSFNDFRFSRAGGHTALPTQQSASNRELSELSSQLYRLVLEERQRLGSATRDSA